MMMDSDFLLKAVRFATKSHEGQFRKFTQPQMPYIMHPCRVMAYTMTMPGCGPHEYAAAVLHDTIEDCKVSFEKLKKEFGNAVATYVQQLTNPSKQSPHLSRAERKQIDLDHYRRKEIWRFTKVIKMIDRLDNLLEVQSAPQDFIDLYCRESIALLGVIGYVDIELRDRILAVIQKLSPTTEIGQWDSGSGTKTTATMPA